MLRDVKNDARSDIDEIVAEIGSKDSDAAALSVAECMAEAGLVGKVFGHNSLLKRSSSLSLFLDAGQRWAHEES